MNKQAELLGEYLNCFETTIEAVEFEERVLSIGDEFLPVCAQDVKHGKDETGNNVEYLTWLIGQIPKSGGYSQ